MISIGIDMNVPDFPKKEVPYGTLVRGHNCKFKVNVTNDGRVTLSNLSVRGVLESYVGQEKPMLFQWADTQVIEALSPRKTVSMEFTLRPFYPGLVSIALYVTDAAKKDVKAKKKTASGYEEAPVRWWLHVADNISLDTLRVLRELVGREKKTKK